VKNKRADYKASELRRKDLVESPVEMFRIWFEQVEGIHRFESTAMTLSTTNKDGKPSSRVVLLKGYDEDGFVFYTNYESRKGREIEENPYGSLNFYWPSQERQVMINGKLRKVSRSRSEKYAETERVALEQQTYFWCTFWRGSLPVARCVCTP
jgi:pyridoxamine 5'-phosphate oxidase